MKDLIQTGETAGLVYDEESAALAGRINGLSTAIKENEKTGTYGALMWVTCKADPDGEKLSSFLQNEAATKPHIVKQYKVMGRGAAVALVKYNDALRNISNIKRFMSELSDGLKELSYVNCCYGCGSTENLGIYNDRNVPVQYCSACARGKLITSSEGRAVPEEKAVSPSPAPAAESKLFADDDMNDLLADTSTSGNDAEYDSSAASVISTGADDSDISGFMLDDSQTNPSVSEEAQKEFGVEITAPKAAPSAPDHSLDDLMFDGDSSDNDSSLTWGAEDDSRISASMPGGGSDLGGLMFDESAYDNDIANDIAEKSEDTSADESGEELNGLMYGEESAQRAADVVHLEVGEKLVTEVTELASIGGSELKFEEHIDEDEDEEFGADFEVTEYHDDSNDGEDIDVTALESKINEPTEVSGGELKVEPAKFDDDGNVPLVNPGMKANRPSSVYEPNAVRAYVGGTYDNATASDEPVGFDGRRKGDSLSGNPRGNDEFTQTRKTGITSISGPAKPSKPGKMPQNYSATVKAISYSGDSKPIVGAIAALLFGLIGAALWAGSGYLFDAMKLGDETGSLIMSFCALLIASLTFAGYRVGGDCFDAKGIIISSVLTVIIDAAGAAAVFITSEFRWSAANLSYSVPFNMAIERMMHGISGHSDGPLIYGRIVIIGIVMLVSLGAAIFVAKKKS